MGEIITIILFVLGIGLGIFISKKDLLSIINKNIDFRPVEGKPDKIEILENNEWKEHPLPKDEKGKQIKINEVKEAGISNEGEMNVKTIKGATDRRNITNNK